MPKTDASDPEYRKNRLRIARMRAGFVTVQDAAEYLLKRGVINSLWTYKAWEEGARGLKVKRASDLEDAFGVDQRGWLLHGNGETLSELERQIARLDVDLRRRAQAARLPDHAQPFDDNTETVNQLTQNPHELAINPSQLVPAGRIPFLLADEIASFLAGERENAMAGRTLAVSDDLAGEHIYSCAIGPSDTSMQGAGGLSFPPGTVLILNSDPEFYLDAQPPFFLLIRRKGMKNWMLRRFESGLPLRLSSEFTLRALNPAVDAIRVTDPENWDIGGLLISSQHRHY